ncbi:MAG TPA: DUF2142 domain-containing protein [Methanobacteriaceae archaeon]|nr:DUF2142 domain-containing protein [Methanobacteriaceae archaeon]
MLLNNEIRPEKVFLVLSLVFGIIFLIVTPPFQVPDESAHFNKAYYVSDGQVIPTKNQLEQGYLFPKSVDTAEVNFSNLPFNPDSKVNIAAIPSLVNLPLNQNDKKLLNISNVLFYPPLPYAAPAFIFIFLKFFNISPLILMYLGRIVNLLLWIFFVYMAIKITPIHKWSFFALSLMPMSIFMAGSLSADSFNMGLAFLVIAFFLNLAFDENRKKIKFKDILLLSLLIWMLSLSKQGYAVLLLLFLIIPLNKFNNNLIRWKYFVFAVLSTLATTFIWNFLSKDANPFFHNVGSNFSISYIFSNVLIFLNMILHTLSVLDEKYLISFVGNFGWLDTPMPEWLVYLYLAFLIIVAFTDKTRIKIDLKAKLIFIITFVVECLFIFFYLYITWNPPGSSIIGGIQGRYFIPIAPLVLLLVYNRKDKLNIMGRKINFKLEKNHYLAVILFTALYLSTALYFLVQRYYL